MSLMRVKAIQKRIKRGFEKLRDSNFACLPAGPPASDRSEKMAMHDQKHDFPQTTRNEKNF